MTEPVDKISRAQETASKKTRLAITRSDHAQHHPDEQADDCVDISEEARERASGRKRKTILEYLEEDGEKVR